jgi:predicted 3-demethylubiquinone-9 3-methyltransferase (glyoxalase superfamily)
VHFVLDGEEFEALNGGPQFTFSPAISFIVDCETQDEVDELWARLTDGGQEGQCGWLTDRFGLSWQIVPRALSRMLTSSDTAAAKRAATAMLGMIKLDVAELQRAFDGK